VPLPRDRTGHTVINLCYDTVPGCHAFAAVPTPQKFAVSAWQMVLSTHTAKIRVSKRLDLGDLTIRDALDVQSRPSQKR